jgi:ABC-type branched-subunit amino acid transport system substrate-binding protein
MEIEVKKLLVVILITLFSIAFIVAQEKMKTKEKQTKSHSIVGYVVDKMCGEKMVMADVKKSDAKAARHTKDCALDEACSAEGYGLVTGGKFYKFDASGDIKGKEYLNATKKENNIKVEVIGTMNDEKLAVESINDFKSTPKKHEEKN